MGEDVATGEISGEIDGQIDAALERDIPLRAVHIDRAHGDAVVLRIAKDLRGRVEAHRLAVEERRSEGRWMVALEPGARIDEEREAGGMRLGKSVA